MLVDTLLETSSTNFFPYVGMSVLGLVFSAMADSRCKQERRGIRTWVKIGSAVAVAAMAVIVGDFMNRTWAVYGPSVYAAAAFHVLPLAGAIACPFSILSSVLRSRQDS